MAGFRIAHLNAEVGGPAYTDLTETLNAQEEQFDHQELDSVLAFVHPKLKWKLQQIADAHGRPVYDESCCCKGHAHTLCGYPIHWNLDAVDESGEPAIILALDGEQAA
ncbi:hypothetical protein ACIRL0_06560 [Streptomyces sp. NPDC102365]|uniref:hypothetical protein n=1 Tax=Streptomyces sp. NPDC102365 TaxID=3366162 RepID=UPI00380A983A